MYYHVLRYFFLYPIQIFYLGENKNKNKFYVLCEIELEKKYFPRKNHKKIEYIKIWAMTKSIVMGNT